MVRIRYKKDEKGFLKSGELLGRNKIYHVVISPQNMMAYITSDSQIVVNAKTLPALKKAVKSELKALGVAFTPEVRPRLKKLISNEEFDQHLKELKNKELLKD